MIKVWLINLLFTSLFAGGHSAVDMDQVRLLYHHAVHSEKSCKELIQITSAFDENNPLLLGYKASATMLMAKHVFNPISKMSYFKSGKQMLEKAIGADAGNMELRFLRFAAQTNSPNFLGYNGNIAEDKNMLLKGFPNITDNKLKQFVLPVLKKSKYLSEEEKKILE